MGTVLSLIGLFTVIKFCIKHRRIVMNKKAFYQSVKELRTHMARGHTFSGNLTLDDIVHNVLGEPEMKTLEILDENLTAHLIKHIQAIKQAKEQDKLKEKAEKVLTTIKELVDSD